MSHFTVLCIGENIVEQLEPFCELECSMSQSEIREDPRAQFEEEYTTEELEKDFIRVKNEHPEYYYETLEEFAEEYHGYSKLDDEDSWGRWTNPNSKWDWYSIGGRWSGYFKIKDNPKYPEDIFFGKPGAFGNKAKDGYADSIRLCDVDFDGMKMDRILDAEKNWNVIQERIANNEKNIPWLYGLKEGETKEDYVNSQSKFSAYALLQDGEWYAKGEMGWFGISSNEDENWSEEMEKLIKSLPEDTLLTIVDCHI